MVPNGRLRLCIEGALVPCIADSAPQRVWAVVAEGPGIYCCAAGGEDDVGREQGQGRRECVPVEC